MMGRGCRWNRNHPKGSGPVSARAATVSTPFCLNNFHFRWAELGRHTAIWDEPETEQGEEGGGGRTEEETGIQGGQEGGEGKDGGRAGDKKTERSLRSKIREIPLDRTPGKCSYVFVTKGLLFKGIWFVKCASWSCRPSSSPGSQSPRLREGSCYNMFPPSFGEPVNCVLFHWWLICLGWFLEPQTITGECTVLDFVMKLKNRRIKDLIPHSNFFTSIFGKRSPRSSLGLPMGRAHTHTQSDHLLLNNAGGYEVVSLLCYATLCLLVTFTRRAQCHLARPLASE